jgi:hypothetical protein
MGGDVVEGLMGRARCIGVCLLVMVIEGSLFPISPFLDSAVDIYPLLYHSFAQLSPLLE